MTTTRTAARPSTKSSSEAGVDVNRLAEALAALTRTTRRELQLPLGASSIAALGTIVEQGPIRLGDLAAHEGVTPATLSRIVAALEESKYAERTIATDDRRSAFIAATPAGRKLLERVRRDRGDALRERIATLSPAHQRALANAIPALEALVRQ